MSFLPKLSINKIRGIEWNELQDGEISLSHTLLSKTKAKINIEESGNFSSIEGFYKEIKTEDPVALNINGKGVLVKTIPGDSEISERTLQAILPHASLEDFYMQRVFINDSSLVCIVRKDKINAILSQLYQKNYRIVALFLGPISMTGLEHIFDENTLLGSTHSLTFSPQIIVDKNEEENSIYSFGSERVKSKNIGSLGAAVIGLLENINIQSLQPTSLEGALEEEKQRKLFRTIGITAMATFFIVLAINLFVFQKLSKEVSFLQEKTNSNSVFLAQMDSLKSELDVKEMLVQSTGIKKQSLHSFFADKIGASLPKEITLKTMSFDGNDKKVKTNKRIVFNSDEIRILGNTKNSSALNEWINNIEEFEFCKFVSLINYIGEGRKKGDFDIKINTK